ncbi:NUMOD4 motif-containing HNH endonuclease [Mycolicibacterium austroafricanum]|uniref:NUMOD4 motif-containing HNH endonuclease n=1 Tax=Mycolicibacterium austroafricanum TaxID=39687 RepID=UPI001CA370A7|nr:NUMOD4 motif-containing HNH endonuclease [Mycolicibacterium austroafricanum]QZT61237.1 NUMOD4 motif-containing HNH endonuclease [Mycolicibacterium austroafricanum]
MPETPSDLDVSTEEWRPIPGFEGYYEASRIGRVRSLSRVVTRTNHSSMALKGRILKPHIRKNNGYYVVGLSRNGKPRNYYVHRLVLMAFRGLPEPGQEGCHENDIRTDNRLENLRWDTHLENVHDAIKRDRLVSIGYYNRDKTECDRGHPFDEENTLIRPEGRGCKKCRRLMERERYHAAKAKQGIPSRAYKPLLVDTEVA